MTTDRPKMTLKELQEREAQIRATVANADGDIAELEEQAARALVDADEDHARRCRMKISQIRDVCETADAALETIERDKAEHARTAARKRMRKILRDSYNPTLRRYQDCVTELVERLDAVIEQIDDGRMLQGELEEARLLAGREAKSAGTGEVRGLEASEPEFPEKELLERVELLRTVITSVNVTPGTQALRNEMRAQAEAREAQRREQEQVRREELAEEQKAAEVAGGGIQFVGSRSVTFHHR